VAKGHQHELGIRGGSSKCSRDKGKLAAIPEAGAVNLLSEKDPYAIILWRIVILCNYQDISLSDNFKDESSLKF
jgi:hypothetical protein